MKRSLKNLLVLALTSAACATQAQTPSTAPASGTASSATSDAGPGLYIKISDANLKKSLMAIPPFQFTGSPTALKNSIRIGKDLYDVFRNDMDVSNYFEFVKPEAYLEDTGKVGLRPAPGEVGGFKFESWKQIGTEFLVRVGYRVSGEEVTVDTYVYYVPQAKLVLSKTYKADAKEIRTVAHQFGNDVIKELTGQRGMFTSMLVVSRSTRPQEKEIFVMDWDGARPRQVSTHKTIAQSPTWSMDGKMLAYSAFAYHPKEKTRNIDLFTYELASGRRFVASYARGINSGASFFPDNKNLLLTISNSGNPDIFKMSLDGKSRTQLTQGKAGEMNVEPVVSPDGRKIAFSSTRSGRPMIYVMDVDGTNPKRMTFAGEYNSTPAWSPDSKKLAFAGLDKTHYDIFVMNADGTNMSRLTSAKKGSGTMADNEDPSFSPDGRHILFRSNRTGKYQLYIVSVDGENERRITFDQYEYFKPRWSPFLD